jgi:AcrR family transcriptional regulator
MNPSEQPPAPVDHLPPDGEPGPVVRRAPFSDNPTVGARGQRTQQRIVDAALQTFGEKGYHQCSIDRITKLAGCSRVSFYQYFSGKEDLFRYLSGQVARQLSASTEALGPLTPDAAGWVELRAWVARYTDVYERYEPVFHAFADAAEADAEVAGGSARTTERNVERIRSRLATANLPARQLDPVIVLLLQCVSRMHDSAGLLRSMAPEAYPKERVADALTDVIHRTFFGLQPDVNVHPPSPTRPPVLHFGPVMTEVLQRDDAGESTLTETGQRTLEALTQAGRDVFVRRGYHRTRVDDIVQAAGVSHGGFYRYFSSKDELAQVLAVHAMRNVAAAMVDLPGASSSDGSAAENGALSSWLRRYNEAHATEASVIRVWVDASLQVADLRPDSAAAIDWGRRVMARYLRPRGFGDIDTEAVVVVTLLSGFGARDQSADATDAAAYIIERGVVGR